MRASLSRFRAFSAVFAALLALGFTAACTTFQYGLQAVTGHANVVLATRPIEDWLNDSTTPGETKERLVRAQAIRSFASHELGLPDNGSYRSYADLKRPAVVWNVFAAPPYSMTLRTWCFPVAGCVPYRGYFDQAAASKFAAQLADEGLETHIAPVSAYSTLGWFDDPLLNTFLNAGELETARLVFHELAHQVAYVPGDAMFNESFATAVENIGVKRWAERSGSPTAGAAWARSRELRHLVLHVLIEQRNALAALYATPGLDQREMDRRKADMRRRLLGQYAELKREHGLDGRYDRLFAGPLNNAQLGSLAVYTRWTGAFERLFENSKDFAEFYFTVRVQARLPPAEREAWLAGLESGTIVKQTVPAPSH